ncbi:MAG: hypothetical protein R3B72_13330 [Polyangiaceae bacterium]
MRHQLGVGAFLIFASAVCGGTAVIDGEADPRGTGGASSSSVASSSSSASSSSASSGAGGTSSGSTTTGVGGGLQEGCPDQKPDSAGSCSPDGLFCDYGGFCNFVECIDGQWAFPLC